MKKHRLADEARKLALSALASQKPCFCGKPLLRTSMSFRTEVTNDFSTLYIQTACASGHAHSFSHSYSFAIGAVA